ncbi:glutathione S-transferase family protein [Celerinatantimonas sp. MCCC 1A17872]|uniref:glutathione S-transferase family protein n=1 Tax=Celerinatantimonas sp. MCCC 1A17872 TaxID=3177514 RepID=UPI0038CA4723
MQLYIGNQNYSTWSLRAWLIIKQFNLEAQITKLKLFSDEFYQTLEPITPTAKVPVLVDGPVTVWESLAILEYINEAYLDAKAWPSDQVQKAKARALAAEMHSGFSALRAEMPMNIRAKRKIQLSEQGHKDLARIESMFTEQMNQYPTGWLFGQWSIADAMYAPVVLRLQSYGMTLNTTAQQYIEKQLNSPALQLWLKQSQQESDIIIEDELGEPLN